jgi:hypothetical protein
VPGRSARDLRVAMDVAGIAVAPGSVRQRAEALREPLRRVVPFQGAWISLLDPERREQPSLVSDGYSAGLIAYIPSALARIDR